mmetsp:Transcript_44126/g.88497  ORF Transcript_44126/g.88497 Transcript_44126/m.88497 type:complete len:287 (+) Transcript_44126:1806-2666(+)
MIKKPKNKLKSFYHENKTFQKKIFLNRFVSIKISNLLLITRIEQKLRFKVHGLKFFPLLLKKIGSLPFSLYNLNIKQTFLDKLFFLNSFKQVPILRFFEKGEKIYDRIPKFSVNLEKDLVKVNFEETADEIKVNLTSNFIRNCISKNFLLGRCWLAIKSSPQKNKAFWYHYLYSCYNFMTKTRTSRECRWKIKKMNSDNFVPNKKTKDLEFFLIRKDLKKLSQPFFLSYKKPIFEFEKENLKLFLSTNKFFLATWRSKGLLKKKISFFASFSFTRKISAKNYLFIG